VAHVRGLSTQDAAAQAMANAAAVFGTVGPNR
jgi:hypothetical protein